MTEFHRLNVAIATRHMGKAWTVAKRFARPRSWTCSWPKCSASTGHTLASQTQGNRHDKERMAGRHFAGRALSWRNVLGAADALAGRSGLR